MEMLLNCTDWLSFLTSSMSVRLALVVYRRLTPNTTFAACAKCKKSGSRQEKKVSTKRIYFVLFFSLSLLLQQYKGKEETRCFTCAQPILS